MNNNSYECCVIGAGPAGLAAANELMAHGITNIIIVDRNKIVGGLARTEIYDGIRFDIGPHRFFTSNTEVNKLWHETLGNDFLPVNRITRIYYKNKYFQYPIKAFDALHKLGPLEATHAVTSFILAKLKSKNEAETVEEWLIHNFGDKLYRTFFKTYTEKVWGIPCNQIGADWASQRIKGLDVIQLLKNAFRLKANNTPKTLVEQFDYPRLGAGQMYEVLADKLAAKGAEIQVQSRVVSFKQSGNSIKSIEVITKSGDHETINAQQFFSSIPLTDFIRSLDPEEAQPIKDAVDALYYRDHITVNLLIDKAEIFPDQWIYVHSPHVNLARIANYNNFSQAMVKSVRKTAISVEYFAFQHDDLWKQSDESLINLAINEIVKLKLIEANSVEGAWVSRDTECYPAYYIGYNKPYQTLKKRVDEFTNLYQIGRAGMYKYNNQDHSIMTGILAARNYALKLDDIFILWDINIDGEYHEGATRPDLCGC